jgi:hypothetical protein
MGISRLTAMTIQSNYPKNIEYLAIKAHKKEKWAVCICLLRGGKIHSDLISTEPFYDTDKATITAMKDVVQEIMKIDLAKD